MYILIYLNVFWAHLKTCCLLKEYKSQSHLKECISVRFLKTLNFSAHLHNYISYKSTIYGEFKEIPPQGGSASSIFSGLDLYCYERNSLVSNNDYVYYRDIDITIIYFMTIILHRYLLNIQHCLHKVKMIWFIMKWTSYT